MSVESQVGVDLALAALVVLVIANYRFRRSILYPPFIFCAMWLLDLFVYRLNLIPVYSLHPVTLVVILLGALIFSIAGVTAFFLPRALVAIRIPIAPTPRRERWRIKYALLALLAIGIAFQIRALFAAGTSGLGEGFMASARTAVVANMVQQDQTGLHGADFWLTYVTSIAIYTAVLFRIERKDRLFWVSAVFALVSCITTTGRAQILLLFSALVCVHLTQTNKESFLHSFRAVRWPVFAFLALFSLLAYTNKNTGGSDAGSFIFAGIISYIIGPLPSLDQVLMHRRDYTGLGNHTFAFFEKLLNQFGILHVIPPSSLGNLFVPFFSNVYTIYGFFITDFGLPGAMLAVAGIGFGQVVLYRRARRGGPIGLFLFALTIYPLIMSIFGDLYTALGIYFGALFFASFYFFICSASLTGTPRPVARIAESQ